MTTREAPRANRPGKPPLAGEGRRAVAGGLRTNRANCLVGAHGYTLRAKGRRAALGRVIGLTLDDGDSRPPGLRVEPAGTSGQAEVWEIPLDRVVWVIPTRREVIVAAEVEAPVLQPGRP